MKMEISGGRVFIRSENDMDDLWLEKYFAVTYNTRGNPIICEVKVTRNWGHGSSRHSVELLPTTRSNPDHPDNKSKYKVSR